VGKGKSKEWWRCGKETDPVMKKTGNSQTGREGSPNSGKMGRKEKKGSQHMWCWEKSQKKGEKKNEGGPRGGFKKTQ